MAEGVNVSFWALGKVGRNVWKKRSGELYSQEPFCNDRQAENTHASTRPSWYVAYSAANIGLR
jgi:hypothetical protein